MTDLFWIFGRLFDYPLCEILIKHIINVTASKRNIWGILLYPKLRVRVTSKEK